MQSVCAAVVPLNVPHLSPVCLWQQPGTLAVVTETTVCSPDVFIGGKEHDGASVAGVQQQADDFVEVGRFVLVRDLQRLSDADSTCRHTGRGLVSAGPITGQHLSVSCRSRGAAVESIERPLQVAASSYTTVSESFGSLPSSLPSVPTVLSPLPPSSPFLSYFPSLFFQFSFLSFIPFNFLSFHPSFPPSYSFLSFPFMHPC